jgi:hypothetical protein
MPLTAAQICTRACQIARAPGFLSQAGDSLNYVLQELCQDYDFDLTRQTYTFNFNPAQLNSLGQAYQNLPSNYLRVIRNDNFYMISGVPYPMIHYDLEEFDLLVEQAGLSNFPVFFATDVSLTGNTNSATGSGGAAVPVMLFWMPPSGAYPATLRYYSQMPDISSPSTSSTVPWFPNQTYLITRVAKELMQDTDDDRLATYEQRCDMLLGKYLKMKDDREDRAQVVNLDRRRFGRAFDRLKNTKQIGW